MTGKLGSLLLAVGVASALAPVATADGLPSCSSVTDAGVWSEDDGLQTQACQADDGITHDAADHQTTVELATCDDVEGEVTSSPAGIAYEPLPGTICELGDNWSDDPVGTASDAASGATLPTPTTGSPDVFALCNELVSSVPTQDLQCA